MNQQEIKKDLEKANKLVKRAIEVNQVVLSFNLNKRVRQNAAKQLKNCQRVRSIIINVAAREDFYNNKRR